MFTRYLLLAARVWDDWDESKHPRKANGQFGTGGTAPKSPLKQAAEAIKPKRKTIKLQRAEYARVMSAINTNFSRFKGRDKGLMAVGSYLYYFYINDFDDYKFYKKVRIK